MIIIVASNSREASINIFSASQEAVMGLTEARSNLQLITCKQTQGPWEASETFNK